MKLTTNSRAFTLLELMVTLAIVIILTTVAYAALQNYFIESKVSDAINGASELQTMIANQIAQNETVTGSGTSLNNVPTSIGRYVASFSVSANGVISITTTADAGAVSFTLSPVYNSSMEQVSWTCAVTSSSFDQYVPSECRI